MDWSQKRVLVTGAGGFIGSHLVEKLVELGAHTRAFVRYNSRGNIGNLEYLQKDDGLELIFGDLRDPDAVLHSMENVDIVFHLAACISIPYSYVSPREVSSTNIDGTLNVMLAARKTNPALVLQVSTSEVYGTAQQIPISETHPLHPQSPYAASKVGSDQIAQTFQLSYGLPVAILRPFNNFGPRQSSRAVIPTILLQCLKNQEKITLGELNSTRDFLYVKDCVLGFIAAAENPKKTVGEVINLGTGEETTIGMLASRIIELTGTKARVVQEAARLRPKASEVMRLCADITKAKNLLGWVPKTKLAEGLEHTISWFREHPEKDSIFKRYYI